MPAQAGSNTREARMYSNLESTPLFNPAATLRAQLRSGYKNTDYAISEIIDNSIEAGASKVDIFLVQRSIDPAHDSGRRVKAVRRIVIVDNGSGFEPNTLNNALTFGYGTHIGDTDHVVDGFGKLGKFGYGLPNSSVATAQDIHVWSWREGIENMLHTNLNVDSILNGNADRQSPIENKQLDRSIARMMQAVEFEFGQSGTVVDWQETERTTWTRSGTLVSHIEETVGRIFRKYIDAGRVVIRLNVFNENEWDESLEQRTVLVNDPLFLMKNSIAHRLLEEKDRDPERQLFVPFKFPYNNSRPKGSYSWSEDGMTHKIAVDIGSGQEAIVTIRFGVTTSFLRKAPYGGSSGIGKLARSNSGVSILRSGRELSLSTAWIPTQDAIERWWGAEVDFPPALDDYFGVTNNKQTAMTLESFATVDVTHNGYVVEYGDTYYADRPDERPVTTADVVDDMRTNGDPRWVSLEIRRIIYSTSREMFKVIKSYGESDLLRPGNVKAADDDDDSDRFPTIVPDDGKPAVPGAVQPDAFTQEGATEENLLDVKKWLESTARVFIQPRVLSTNELFDYQTIEDRILIILNQEHPAYDMLFNGVDVVNESLKTKDSEAKLTEEEMVYRLRNVRISLVLLIYSMVVSEDSKMDRSQLRFFRRYRQSFSDQLWDKIEAFNKALEEEGGLGKAVEYVN